LTPDLTLTEDVCPSESDPHPKPPVYYRFVLCQKTTTLSYGSSAAMAWRVLKQSY
jgi:hypothetical protein